MIRSVWFLNLIALISLLLSSCTTENLTGRFTHLGAPYMPLTKSDSVKVYAVTPANIDFDRIARLDVHIERSSFETIALHDALPELIRQARLSGSQAIIDIEERSSRMGEKFIYHVIASGIRYKNQ